MSLSDFLGNVMPALSHLFYNSYIEKIIFNLHNTLNITDIFMTVVPLLKQKCYSNA